MALARARRERETVTLLVSRDIGTQKGRKEGKEEEERNGSLICFIVFIFECCSRATCKVYFCTTS